MQDDYYTRGEKEFLLKIARTTLENLLRRDDKYEPQTVNQKLWEKRGVFVSLYKNGDLRGCIGNVEPIESLIISVRDDAIASANDPRFSSLEEPELEDIKIEISILTEPEKVEMHELKHGDGVIIAKGANKATYLPQVWGDLSDPEEFLGSLCQKAGLNKLCYQDQAVDFYRYQTIIFKEGKI